MYKSAANVVSLHAGELWLLLKHGTWRRMFWNVLVMSVRKNERSVPSPEMPRGMGGSRPGAEVSPFPGVQKLFSRLRKRWPVWPRAAAYHTHLVPELSLSLVLSTGPETRLLFTSGKNNLHPAEEKFLLTGL